MSARQVMFLYHIPKTAGQSVRHALSAQLGLHEGYVQVGPFGDKRSRIDGVPPLAERSVASLTDARVLSGHYLRADMRNRLPGAEIVSAIILREPAARLVSHYNHAMFTRTAKCGLPLVEFERWYLDDAVPRFPWERLSGRPLEPDDVRAALVSVGHDYMAKFVLHAHGDVAYPDYDEETLFTRAAEILDGFAHVGAVEAMAATQAFLSQQLGCTIDVRPHNVGRRRRTRALTATDDLIRRIREQNRIDVRLYERYRAKLGSPR